MKKLFIILTIVLTLTTTIAASVGYCGSLDDPEPWSVQSG